MTDSGKRNGTKPRLCVLTEAYSPVVGGAESHIRLLLRQLKRAGFVAFVLTRRSLRPLPHRGEVDGIPVIRVLPWGCGRWGKYGMLLPAAWRLVRLRKEYDILYVCGFRVLGLVAIPLARWLKKGCVLKAECCGELDGGFMHPGFERAGRPPAARGRPGLGGISRLRKRILLRGDCFVSISREIEKEFRAEGVNDRRLVRITNGIDLDRFRVPTIEERRNGRKEIGIPENAVVYSYTGKLNRGKGLDVLLKAWRKVREEERDPRLLLLLVGSGGGHFLSCEEEVQRFVRDERMESEVMITGYVEDVERYLRASDFFVFPSESEALGISLIEAMATGLPAIASDTGGIRDIITDGVDGLLAAPGDWEDLFRKMQWMRRHPEEADRMAKAGRAMVARTFGILEITKDYQDLFETIGSCRSGRTVS